MARDREREKGRERENSRRDRRSRCICDMMQGLALAPVSIFSRDSASYSSTLSGVCQHRPYPAVPTSVGGSQDHTSLRCLEGFFCTRNRIVRNTKDSACHSRDISPSSRSFCNKKRNYEPIRRPTLLFFTFQNSKKHTINRKWVVFRRSESSPLTSNNSASRMEDLLTRCVGAVARRGSSSSSSRKARL